MDWSEAFERELDRIEAEREANPTGLKAPDPNPPKTWSEAIDRLLIEQQTMVEQHQELFGE
ncbi:hypothetical protein SH139x_002805 [Planctomycetaceae bacterium SH139]